MAVGGDLPVLDVHLGAGESPDHACTELAHQLHRQFTTPLPADPGAGAYEVGCSMIVLPERYETYLAQAPYEISVTALRVKIG